MRSQRPMRSPHPTPTTGWREYWNVCGCSSAPMRVAVSVSRVHGCEPLELNGWSRCWRRRQFLDNAVDDPADPAAEPVEIQRAVLEVLLHPLRLLEFGARRQAQGPPLVAERGPRVVDGAGDRLRTGVWGP